MENFIPLFMEHPDPVFLADRKGAVVFWNPAAEALVDLPWTRENREVFADEAAHRFQPSLGGVFSESLEKGLPHSTLVWPLPMDPNLSPIEMVVTPVTEGNEVVGAWARCRKKALGADAHQANGMDDILKRVNAFLASTVNGIVVLDTKGKVLIFNKSMEHITGYYAEEVVGVPGALDLFYGWDTAKENMEIMRSDKHGPAGRLEMYRTKVMDRKGDKIPVSLSASVVKQDGEETGSVGVFSDLRESLRMENELQAAQQRLIEADRKAALWRLSASVAHEINNPLSGILLFAEILAPKFKEDGQSYQDLKQIIDQTLRCKKIVENLLSFSRKSSGQKKSFDLHQAFRQCLAMLLPQPRFQNIEVLRYFQKDIPAMKGDMVQIQQVFTNLVVNAADALEGKGAIRLSSAYDAEADAFHLEFADTGPGIPDSEKEKIFEGFYTTKPVGYGTGLGLSISQDIIKAHGGSIRIRDNPGGGTVFVVQLPREFGTDSLEPAGSPGRKKANARRKKRH